MDKMDQPTDNIFHHDAAVPTARFVLGVLSNNQQINVHAVVKN